MGLKSTDNFTCDRCDYLKPMGRGEQPEGWVSMLVWGPPLMAPSEASGDTPPISSVMLCKRCCEAVVSAIEGKPVEEVVMQSSVAGRNDAAE